MKMHRNDVILYVVLFRLTSLPPSSPPPSPPCVETIKEKILMFVVETYCLSQSSYRLLPVPVSDREGTEMPPYAVILVTESEGEELGGNFSERQHMLYVPEYYTPPYNMQRIFKE
jgi:hypothetical protein